MPASTATAAATGGTVLTRCPECGERFVFTSSHFAVCPNGHGRLRNRRQTELAIKLEDEESKRAAWENFHNSLPVAIPVSNRRNDVIKRYRVNGKDMARVLGAVRLLPVGKLQGGSVVYAVVGNSVYRFVPLEGAEDFDLPVATVKRRS